MIARRFFKNIDKFLEISAKHKIRPMIVFFDGVWDPDPQSGPQNRPRAGVHNSGWVQSPGRVILADNAKQDALESYVTDVVKRYAKDKRVLAWDLFNEPDNLNGNSYGPLELKNKDEVAARLVRETFEWARAGQRHRSRSRFACGAGRRIGIKTENAQQGSPGGRRTERRHFVPRLRQTRLMNSRIRQLRKYGRPLICTEFMARGNGSTFEAILPILKKEKVAAYCWGLVDGKIANEIPVEHLANADPRRARSVAP